VALQHRVATSAACRTICTGTESFDNLATSTQRPSFPATTICNAAQHTNTHLGTYQYRRVHKCHSTATAVSTNHRNTAASTTTTMEIHTTASSANFTNIADKYSSQHVPSTSTTYSAQQDDTTIRSLGQLQADRIVYIDLYNHKNHFHATTANSAISKKIHQCLQDLDKIRPKTTTKPPSPTTHSRSLQESRLHHATAVSTPGHSPQISTNPENTSKTCYKSTPRTTNTKTNNQKELLSNAFAATPRTSPSSNQTKKQDEVTKLFILHKRQQIKIKVTTNHPTTSTTGNTTGKVRITKQIKITNYQESQH
jgi:hypothetical protein